MTNDAVKRTLEKLTAYENREKELAREDARIENIQKTKNKEGSLVWNTLVRWMEKHCADCNSEKGEKKLDFKADGSNQFQVVLNKIRGKITLQVVFEPERCEVSYTRDFGGLANVADKSILGGSGSNIFCRRSTDMISPSPTRARACLLSRWETMIQFLLDTLPK